MAKLESSVPRKRLRPKTYSFTVYFVAVFILVQLVILLFSAFLFRQRFIRIETSGPALMETWTEPERRAALEVMNPRLRQPVAVELPNLPMPAATPRLSVPRMQQLVQQISRLNDEAREHVRLGEYDLAAEVLDRAAKLSPGHLLTLANTAILEEARGNPAEAVRLWKDVLAASTPGEIIHTQATERIFVLELMSRLAESARDKALARESLPRRIFIESHRTLPAELPERPLQFTQEFVLSVRPEESSFDPGKLLVRVAFYDQDQNQELRQAGIEAVFANETPDWKSKSEVLRVTYRLEDSAGDPVRRFYGFVLRLYYDEELQDEIAVPEVILSLESVAGSR